MKNEVNLIRAQNGTTAVAHTFGSSVVRLEKQFTSFTKEQSDVNTVNNKKFNSMISQVNQLGYIVQNSNTREVNSVNTQMSPERNTNQQQQQQQQKYQHQQH